MAKDREQRHQDAAANCRSSDSVDGSPPRTATGMRDAPTKPSRPECWANRNPPCARHHNRTQRAGNLGSNSADQGKGSAEETGTEAGSRMRGSRCGWRVQARHIFQGDLHASKPDTVMFNMLAIPSQGEKGRPSPSASIRTQPRHEGSHLIDQRRPGSS